MVESGELGIEVLAVVAYDPSHTCAVSPNTDLTEATGWIVPDPDAPPHVYPASGTPQGHGRHASRHLRPEKMVDLGTGGHQPVETE